jgi:PAS domain S-box-containing protein
MQHTSSEVSFAASGKGDAALSNTHFQLRRFLDKLPVGAYTCDAEGLITYFNQHATQLWGRTPKLNAATDRFCGSFKLFAPDGSPIDHSQCWMALALKTGLEYNGQEIVIEHPDGRRVTVLAHASPFRDEAGQIVGALNVLVDINERKAAEVSQARLAAIVESSDDAIIGKSLDGRILSWNAGAERIFGYTAAEAIGRSITLIIPAERWEEERSILAHLRRGERVEHFETVRLTKVGRRIDVSLTSSPVRDGSGRIVGASKVARDITDRK